MKLAALISGGKDSVYAAFLAGKEHELACLITISSANPDSYMFHTPNVSLVKEQAKAMGIPLVFKETKGEKEKELIDLKEAVKGAKERFNVKGLVSGAIASTYQKERVDKICRELGIESIAPLWGISPESYLSDLLKNNFEVIITCIAAEGIDKSFLGKTIDKNLIKKLSEINKKYKVHIAGEGGEYETFVINCPLFKNRLKIKKKIVRMESAHSGKCFLFV